MIRKLYIYISVDQRRVVKAGDLFISDLCLLHTNVATSYLHQR